MEQKAAYRKEQAPKEPKKITGVQNPLPKGKSSSF